MPVFARGLRRVACKILSMGSDATPRQIADYITPLNDLGLHIDIDQEY